MAWRFHSTPHITLHRKVRIDAKEQAKEGNTQAISVLHCPSMNFLTNSLSCSFSFQTILFLFVFLVPFANATISLCPTKTHVQCSKEAQYGSTPIQITIESETEEPFQLYWVNLDCKEQLWSTISPGASIIITTYAGHLWRGKSVLDKAVVLEYLIPSENRDKVPTIKVKDCTRAQNYKEDIIGTNANMLAKMKAINVVRTVPTNNMEYQKKWRSIYMHFPQCNPKYDLSDTKVPGFFVLCAAEKWSVSKGIKTLHVAGFRSQVHTIVTFECPESAFGSPLGMRYCIKSGLNLKHDSTKYANPPQLPNWVMWEASGRRKVHVASQMVPSKNPNNKEHTTGRIFLFTGGNFVWPGIKIGYERSVGTVTGRYKPVTIKTMSLRPLVYQVNNFLSMSECDHIIGLAKPHMGASVVTHMDGDEGKCKLLFS